MYDDWEMVRCCFLCVWMVRECRFANHSFGCVCVCAVGAVVWVEKGKHVIMVIIVKNITGKFISCERWNERTHEEQRERERGMERKGRESESWNGMEMVLTSTKINASLTAFVRQWFFNCFSLPLPPTTTNGDDDEWTNNDDDDDFICLQFTLWKMKMSVLMFSLPSNKHRAAHICIPSFPQEVAKPGRMDAKNWGFSLCVCMQYALHDDDFQNDDDEYQL